MATKEMYLFKNEIYNKLRELETKFFSQLSNKNSEINLNLTTFNDKVNSIMESNKQLIESIAAQKLSFEKINELSSSKRFMDEALLSQNIKIKNILAEIDKMNYRYEKMINENIIIPGYVGPGCDFKNIGDFIKNVVKEIKKLKDENEQKKRDEKDIKAKVDLVTRNMTSMIEYNSTKIKEFTTLKDNELNSLLDDKLQKYTEKSNEINQNFMQTQNKLEEKLKEIGIEIEKINDSKIDINTVINNKFAEINKREEQMSHKLFSALEEVKEVQKMKKELNEQIKNIYIKIDNMNKNKSQNRINDEKRNQNFLGNKPDNLRNFGTMTKNNLPNLNKGNYTLTPNDFLIKTKNEKKKISIRHDSKKELNTNILDKKIVLKENNFTRTSKNLKIDININKELDTKEEPPIIKSVKNNNLINSGQNIREKIFQKTLNNIKLDKKDNKSNKILSNLGIQNFMKKMIGNNKDTKVNLANLEYDKTSKKKLSMSDDEALRNFKTQNNSNNNNLIGNNENSILIQKNIQTNSRNNHIVDCNLVNLNLLEVPNINDNNNNNSTNSFSNFNDIYKPFNRRRKIKSVDAKRPIKVGLKFEKTSYKFYSSKAIGKI